jgi:hypothetical protein
MSRANLILPIFRGKSFLLQNEAVHITTQELGIFTKGWAPMETRKSFRTNRGIA